MSGYDFYVKGKRNLHRPLIARKYFEISYSFANMRYKSLLKLIMLDINESNYKSARKLINTGLNDYQNYVELYIFRSFLEFDEYNFNKCRSLIFGNMNEDNYINILLKSIDIDIQLRDFSQAEKKILDLMNNDNTYLMAVFRLVSLKILEGDYEVAMFLLKSIEVKKLSKSDLYLYRDFMAYLKYLKGELEHSNVKLYKHLRLLEEGNNSLYDHLKKHKKARHDHNDGCFLSDINFKNLVSKAESYLERVRPIHHLATDKYRFRMDRTIGKLGDVKMRDLCVVTHINTKKIIAMYPIILSEGFDSEGYGVLDVPSSNEKQKIILPN